MSAHRRPWSWWWVQVVVVFVVVQAYRIARTHLEGSPAAAMQNALDLVHVERVLHIFHEETLQEWLALPTHALARFWDVFYGLAHDLVGYVVLILLWRRSRERYRFWRNVAGWMLGLALLGFWAYPLTPPRLMPGSYGFVDTGVEIGGVGPMQGATKDAGGNRFAAMPSLHVGRSSWVPLALLAVIRKRRWKWLVVAYPFVMLTATVVTANHWFLDGVGGLACLAVALALELGRAKLMRRPWPRRVLALS